MFNERKQAWSLCIHTWARPPGHLRDLRESDNIPSKWIREQLILTGFYCAFWEFLESFLSLEMAYSPGRALTTELGSWLRHTRHLERPLLWASTVLIALEHHRDVYLICAFRACSHLQYVTTTLPVDVRMALSRCLHIDYESECVWVFCFDTIMTHKL